MTKKKDSDQPSTEHRDHDHPALRARQERIDNGVATLHALSAFDLADVLMRELDRRRLDASGFGHRGPRAMMTLEATGHELARTAKQIADIAIELNGAARDLGGNRKSLLLRALGVQAEADRLAMAALSARASAEQIACEARKGSDATP